MKGNECYHCKGCKQEFWLPITDTVRRGSICPNGCTRNLQVYLGETEAEIVKRRKEFVENEGYTFEVNPEMDDPNLDGDTLGTNDGGILERNDYFFD